MMNAPMRGLLKETNNIAIIQAYYFLDYYLSEKRPVGGGNRYLYDLGRLFCNAGYSVVYIQKGIANRIIDYEDWAKVIAIKAPMRAWGDLVYAYRAYKLLKVPPGLLCYGNLEDCFPFVRKRGFAIQHGIWWDYPLPIIKKKLQYARIRYVLKKIRCVICVDSSFINWVRTSWPKMNDLTAKLRFVANYADTKRFIPSGIINERKILLFPRRFEEKRGYEVFLRACGILIKRGFDFDIYLLGDGEDLNNIKRLIEKESLQERSHIIKCMPEEMPEYYQKAFLTYIPTLWSEGTSLSAVEAICSGCPVIATDVGGLPNIIINGFNGFIIKPDAEEIANITEYMMKHADEYNQLVANCVSLRNVLSKERWEKQVLAIINLYDKETCHQHNP